MSVKSIVKDNEVLTALDQSGQPDLGWTALKLEFVSGWRLYKEDSGYCQAGAQSC